MKTNSPYDIVALTSNDLVTDRRMQRCLTSLSRAGYKCLLLGRKRSQSQELDHTLPFDQERHDLARDAGKRFYVQLNLAHYRRIRELKPKSVLVVDVDTMLGGAAAAESLSIPWVYDAHEYFIEAPELHGRPMIQQIWEQVARRFIPRSKARYTVGAAIAEAHEQHYGLPFGVVRNAPPAIDPTHLNKKKHDTFTVLYQGAINMGRGLEYLLEAAAQLPELRFELAGTGGLDDQLRRQAKALGLSNVTFHGEVPPRELPEITTRAHLGYALLEPMGMSYQLSLSNKSLDYLQAELPSLQSNFPEYQRINAAFGCYHLVDELTVDSVVGAIRQVQGDAAYYNRLKQGCRSAAQVLNWEKEEQELIRLWEEVLPRTPASKTG